MQLAGINIFNVALFHDVMKKAKRSFTPETVVPCVLHLFDHSDFVLKGKALVTLAMMSQLSQDAILAFCSKNAVGILERLNKEKVDYLGSCVQIVCDTLLGKVDDIMEAIANEIRKTKLQDNACYFTVVVYLTASPLFRSRIMTPNFLHNAAEFVARLEDIAVCPAAAKFKEELFILLEAISQSTNALVQHNETVLKYLVPALLQLVNSPMADVRLFGLRVFISMFETFMTNPSIYTLQLPGNTSTQLLNKVISHNILASGARLLQDDEPVPTFFLTALNVILRRNIAFIEDLWRLSLVPEPLWVHALAGNFHAARAVLIIVEAADTTKPQLYKADIVGLVCEMLKRSYDRGWQYLFEPALDIALCLVKSDENHMWSKENKGLLQVSSVIAVLMSHTEGSVSKRSASLLLILFQLYRDTKGAFTADFIATSLAHASKLLALKVLLKIAQNVLQQVPLTASHLRHSKLFASTIARLGSGSSDQATAGVAQQIAALLGTD
eukprot:TRINITY_DN2616_c0_g1_i3.p2 TRINITY_DN2616_c0_g1~~TRINITY_DN2616_c0_g1_i3.p2  ORF type:complete len:498 (-),score=151.21 TRINITY_DN2616_c0_g1_i3:76-1569(-)